MRVRNEKIFSVTQQLRYSNGRWGQAWRANIEHVVLNVKNLL